MKRVETIKGAELRVGLISTTQIDNGGIEVKTMSGEILLDAREEGMSRKDGICQEDTGVKGILFEMVCFLTPVSLLQVYFVLASQTSQKNYLCRAVFVQRLSRLDHVHHLTTSLTLPLLTTAYTFSSFALPL